MQVAVIFFGLPAAGKTTHARLLAEAIGGVHIEPSALIQEVFSSDRATDALDDGTQIDLRIERRRFEAGELNDSRWINALVRRAVLNAAAQGRSAIFSGGMRKRVEAEALMPLLQELFGKERCVVVFLEVPEEVAVARLEQRGRALDANSALRFQRFYQETMPAATFLSDHWGVPIIRLASTRPVEYVECIIRERLKKHFGGELCIS